MASSPSSPTATPSTAPDSAATLGRRESLRSPITSSDDSGSAGSATPNMTHAFLHSPPHHLLATPQVIMKHVLSQSTRRSSRISLIEAIQPRCSDGPSDGSCAYPYLWDWWLPYPRSPDQPADRRERTASPKQVSPVDCVLAAVADMRLANIGEARPARPMAARGEPR